MSGGYGKMAGSQGPGAKANTPGDSKKDAPKKDQPKKDEPKKDEPKGN